MSSGSKIPRRVRIIAWLYGLWLFVRDFKCIIKLRPTLDFRGRPLGWWSAIVISWSVAQIASTARICERWWVRQHGDSGVRVYFNDRQMPEHGG